MNIQTLTRITTRRDLKTCKPMHESSPKKRSTSERKKNENARNVNCARLLLQRESRCLKACRWIPHPQYWHLQQPLLTQLQQWMLNLIPLRRKEVGSQLIAPLLHPLLLLLLHSTNRAGQLSVHLSPVSFHRHRNRTLHPVGLQFWPLHRYRHL